MIPANPGGSPEGHGAPDPIAGLLGRTVEPGTRDLLVVAAAGDPVLLRVLVLAGLGTGALRLEAGRWRWQTAPDGASSARRASADALRTLSDEVVRRYLIAPGLDSAADSPDPGGFPESPAGARLELTDRQLEILVLLGDGLTVQAIARKLCLSPRTVAKHQERMYRKLGTSDRLSTVLRAQRLGLLEPVR